MPPGLRAVIDDLALLDRTDRIEYLIAWGERFREVPPEVATRPFDEANRVPGCESEAFVWATPRPDGARDLHFAVENPQGVSAKALAAILRETCSGRPPSELRDLDDDVVFAIFGRELSMGKSLGLTHMVRIARELGTR